MSDVQGASAGPVLQGKACESGGTLVSTETEQGNVFVYRGVPYERHDVMYGYWGHYATSAGFEGKRLRSQTRPQLLQRIDDYLESEAARAVGTEAQLAD